MPIPSQAHLPAVSVSLSHVVLVTLGYDKIAGIIGAHVQAGNDALRQASQLTCSAEPESSELPCAISLLARWSLTVMHCHSSKVQDATHEFTELFSSRVATLSVSSSHHRSTEQFSPNANPKATPKGTEDTGSNRTDKVSH
jgi:GMP synthase-like glutamine amidotransferase